VPFGTPWRRENSLDNAPAVLREHFLTGGTKAILTA
jgi:hypothetical protein